MSGKVYKVLYRVSYGKPKPIKGWPIVDKTTNVGVKLFQLFRARPVEYGYRKGRRK